MKLTPILETNKKVVYSISENINICVMRGEGIVLTDSLRGLKFVLFPEELDNTVAAFQQAKTDIIRKKE